MVKRLKPKRSYRTVIESLRQVWQIESVTEQDCIWRQGDAENAAFSPDKIRLAVWNLCKGSGGHLFEHDYRSLCYRSDLILTQEALLSQRGLRMFFGERGFETIHAASYKRRDGLRDGVMTMSRAASIGEAIRVICKYPEPVLKTPKAALIKFYPLAGRPEKLMVVNIHATLIRSIRAAIEEMEHLMSCLPQHEGPMILAGDFNTFTPGYLLAISGFLHEFGLKYISIPDDPRPRSAALDQVFCRGLEVTSARIDTTIKNSDHFPLLLHLKLIEAAAS